MDCSSNVDYDLCYAKVNKQRALLCNFCVLSLWRQREQVEFRCVCFAVYFLCTFTLASKGAREFRRHLRSAISVLVDRVYILKGTLFYLRSYVLYLIKENEFPRHLSSLPTDYNFQY